MMRKYTQEERQFFIDFVPGHSHKEIMKEFNRRFPPIGLNQVKAYIKNNGLNTGRTGRFKKGQEAHNKGKKMSPEVYKKAKATMFKKGSVPANRSPIGAEKLREDGYWWVKIKDGYKNANWTLKHRKLWEDANGPIPEGKLIIFADGDRDNFDLDNLRMIDHKHHAIINHMGLSKAGDGLDTAILVADIQSKIGEVRRRK